MIRAEQVTKTFDKVVALKDLSCVIQKGSVYGLVGSNGAGKSTFLRLATGIYAPDKGSISIDGENVWENPLAKNKFVLVPDELYFLPQANMHRMAKLYQACYEKFDPERFAELTDLFQLNPKASIGTFSKGMKRQAAMILALSCCAEYLFFDETYDGLDPVMRNLVKQLIAKEVAEYNTTVVIASHSLRELEDVCDQLTLLHQGGIVFESDVKNLKTSLFKIQVGYDYDYDKELFADIEMLEFVKRGRISNFIARGDKEEIVRKLENMDAILIDVLPLSLEEVFVHEMEALGYAFREMVTEVTELDSSEETKAG